MTHILSIYQIKEAKIDFILAIAFTILVCIILSNMNSLYMILTYLEICCTVAATLLGFLLAAYALLLAFPKEGYMNLITLHPNYPFLYRYFILALYVIVGYLIVAFTGLLFPVLHSRFEIPFCVLLIFLLVYSLIIIIRIISLLNQLTDQLFKK